MKNTRRPRLPLLLLLLAALPLVTRTRGDETASARTPAPETRWSLVGVLVRNTLGAVEHDLAELAPEFPQLKGFEAEARVTERSLNYAKGRAKAGGAAARGAGEYAGETHAGDGCRVAVEFRHPLTQEEADRLGASWRVYRLKNGKLLAAWSHVGAAPDARGRRFVRVVGGVLRAAEAQLLDHAGADARGSTRDLGAVPFEGWLEEGRRYRAEIAYDRRRREWVTAEPLTLPHHHFGRIEWLNVGHFPGLYFDRPPGARVEVVFEVVAKQVLRRAARTWTTYYECRIIGVEGRDPPPRADYLTLVARCRRVRGTMKRNAGAYFTFDVRRVVAGRFDAREFTIELTGEHGANALMQAVGGRDLWQGEGDCSSSKELELTFEAPGEGRRPEHPGFLHEFRVIE